MFLRYLREIVLSFIASWIIRALRLSWRVRIIGPDPKLRRVPLIYCFWHGRQAGLFAYPRRTEVVVLSSLSRDGAIQARILNRLGFTVARGSSSRHGAAGLKSLIQEVLNNGADAAFAVDGPRGPKHVCKAGAIAAARRTGGLLVPVTCRASKFWKFDSAWDDYLLPWPFARVELVQGEAIRADGENLHETRMSVEKALFALEKGPAFTS